MEELILVRKIRQSNSHDCLASCLSSLTGIRKSVFPDIRKLSSDEWFGAYNDILFLYGYQMLNVDIDMHHELIKFPYIAVGQSSRFPEHDHAVIHKKGKEIFNPGPFGIKGEPKYYILIFKEL